MKIYQVEELVGITKKNIRFYEDEGLLNPERNPENGYREYSLKDVRQLEKIKLLRKLDVPLEEIRLLQKGNKSFGEIMNCQINLLEKKQKDAKVLAGLCSKLKDEVADFSQLDASLYLSEMIKMEKEGTEFTDIARKDINRKKKTGSIIAAVSFTILILAFMIPGIILCFKDKSVWALSFVFIALVILFICGMAVMLFQRLKEIDKGEEYEARKY